VKKLIVVITLGSLLFFSNSSLADLTKFQQFFANPNFGEDPGQPDTVYAVCLNQTATQQIIQVRLKTDNVPDSNYIQGVIIILLITADATGVSLDTTANSFFAGTSLALWEILSVYIETSGGDPGVLPMKLVFGGVNIVGSDDLHPGDHLIANLIFTLSEPSGLCIDTTFSVSPPDDTFRTVLGPASGSFEYTPQWRPACCGPVVPTLSQYGLLIFAVLLFGLMVYAIKKAKRVLT